MIIKRVELSNWGPHKKLEFDTDSHIVGIIGSNGKGKSNLLQAISYALTGDLDKTKGTAYIRNFGHPDAAKEAVVKVVFQKGAEEGTIVRRIKDTGTTSRQMTWGGKTLKSAAEVEKMMAEILGADKEAMKNAVYIKQGDIAKMVKGTPSERQEINLKLMNLNFTEQRTEKIRQTKAVLSNGLIDYLQIESMLSDSLDQSNSNLKNYKNNLKEFENAHNIVTWLQKVYAAVVEKANSARMLDSLNAQRMDVEFQKKTLVSTTGSKEGVEEKLKAAKLEKERLVTAKRNKAEVENILKELNEVHDTFTSLSAKLDDLKKNEVSSYTEDQIKDLDIRYNFIVNSLSVLANHHLAEDKLASAKSDLESAKEEFIKLHTNNDKYTSLIENRRNLIKKITEVSNNIAIAAMVDTDKCPICCGDVSEEIRNKFITSREDNKKILDTLNAQLDVLEKSIKSEEDARSASSAKLSLSATIVDKYEKSIEQNKENNKKYFEFLGKEAEAEQELHSIKYTVETYHSILAELKSLPALIKEASNRRESLRKRFFAIQPVEEDPDTLDTLIADQETTCKLLEDIIKDYEVLDGKLNQITALLKENTDSFNTCCENLASYQEEYSDIDISDISIRSIQDLITSYRSQEMEYSALSSLINKTESEIRETECKLLQCRQNIKKNNDRISLIEDLQSVIDVTCKNGIPLAYANEVFAHITPMVQDMLEKMQANFTVNIDPDRPMTYKFIRTDNDSGYEMPQERLSGGQAIRLAIALLIACQQAILPDVGLLILDEPSSHVDAEGVEHMRDMFMQLEDILMNSNMQVILVDHNPTLVAAFDKTIKL